MFNKLIQQVFIYAPENEYLVSADYMLDNIQYYF